MELSPKVPLVVIRGAGDLGSGVAYRLIMAGYAVIMTELERPVLVRRAVSFGNAIFENTMTIEGIVARRIETSSALWLALRTDEIPVIIDSNGAWHVLKPQVVIDARMVKRNIDTKISDAPLVIALGPGFTTGEDCHVVIETNRGHWLGRVIWRGSAQPNTGTPGDVLNTGATRVLRAPCDGFVIPHAKIGDSIEESQLIATVGGQPVVAPFKGMLRGLIHESVPVKAGLKIGDLDPRCVREHCFTISDKSLAIGGGVLEAILSQGIYPLDPTRRAMENVDASF